MAAAKAISLIKTYFVSDKRGKHKNHAAIIRGLVDTLEGFSYSDRVFKLPAKVGFLGKAQQGKKQP